MTAKTKRFTKHFVNRLSRLESCLEQLSEPGRQTDWREVADAREAAKEMRLQFSEFFEVLSDRKEQACRQGCGAGPDEGCGCPRGLAQCYDADGYPEGFFAFGGSGEPQDYDLKEIQ